MNDSTAKLCELVTNNRIKTLTIAFFKTFELDSDVTKAIVITEVQALKNPYYNAFSQWSENELESYLEWQNSPIPEKINQALLDKDASNGYHYLSDEEVETIKEFAASDLGKKKDALDAALKPQRDAVKAKIESELKRAAEYYSYQ